MSRIFIAISMTADATSTLNQIQHTQLSDYASHWVPTSHFHLTLGFLGQQNAQHIDALCNALRILKTESFKVTFNHLAALHAGCIALCADNPPEPLLTLHKQIQTICAPYSPEKRFPFKPHITLVKHAPSLDFKTIDVRPNLTIAAQAYAVFESKKTMGRLDYEPLAWFPLG
jgi:2'-5' RNA ligase